MNFYNLNKQFILLLSCTFHYCICILLLLPHIAFANNYSSINYTIHLLHQEKIPIIKIEAEISGQLSNKLILDLPYKWGGVDYTDQTKNIQVGVAGYKSQINTKDAHQLIITIPHQTNTIKVSYEIHQKVGNSSDIRNVIVRNNLIHSIGYGLFVTPADMQNADEVLFNIGWQNIPDKWSTISSHGTASSLKFVGTAPQLLHAIYAVGKLRIYHIGEEQHPIVLSLYGAFDIQDDVIVSSVNKIISGQRAFFSDYDFPYYVISLVEGDDPHFMGGTRLDNSFTAYLPHGMRQSDYYILFAHEHLHNWIGGKISNNEQEALHYWWTEGFADYYARVLALRSGVISIGEFIAEYNQFLKNYYLSPVRNEPNIRINKDFWNDYNVEKLPYYRGLIFAIYLNNIIKINDPNKSLDNIMIDLLAAKQEFSIELFKNIVKKYIPQGIEAEISELISKGKTINLDSAMNILPIEKTNIEVCDLGFDENFLLNNQIIKKLNPKSNAYKSGIRNGDKIVEWSLPNKHMPDQVVTIKTDNHIFQFKSLCYKQDIVQFKIKLSIDDQFKIKQFFGI